MAADIGSGDETSLSDDVSFLCVGLTVVDMITVVGKYPEEDSDQRGISFRKQRGGNASNASTVLTSLGNTCQYLGVLPSTSDPDYRWLKDDFNGHGIKTDLCVNSDRTCPMANVVVSRDTGSRTIIFCDNGQPELSLQQFMSNAGKSLHCFTWIHFELRPNVEDYLHMLETVEEYRTKTAQRTGKEPHTVTPYVSVEIEKPELSNPERAMMLADVIFISKDWARCKGWEDMTTAVSSASRWCRPHCTVICPWAEEGAAAWCNNEVVTSTASPPGEVIDTLGAGDTFVAGFLHTIARHKTVSESLNFACKLAAAKCTIDGFKGLQGLVKIEVR
ncbi:ketohexokinase-like isoform X1 [Littorina saxatilis]